MAIHDLYSKRQKRLRDEVPDVYIYDEFPIPFSVQVSYLLDETLGNQQEYYSSNNQTSRTYR